MAVTESLLFQEFRLNRLTFRHSRVSDFLESQWNWFKPRVYAAYRVTLALFVIAWFVFDFTSDLREKYHGRFYYWLLFATNWSFLCFVVASVSLAILTVVYNCRNGQSQPVRSYKFCWLMYTLALNNVLVTSSIYWFAYVSKYFNFFSTEESKAKHGLNACLIIFDFLISAVPIRLYHAVYPSLLAAVYILFTVIYWSAGGEGPTGRGYIYPTLNWSTHPGPSAVACFCGILVTLLFQIALYVIYLIRGGISSCLRGRGFAPEIKNVDDGTAQQLVSDEEAAILASSGSKNEGGYASLE